MVIGRKALFVLMTLTLLIGPFTGVVMAQDEVTDGYSLSFPQVANSGNEYAIETYYVSQQDQEAALDYADTYEARKGIEPLPWPEYESQLSANWDVYSEPIGLPGSSPSGPPAIGADTEAQQVFADEWARIETDEINDAVEMLEAMGAFDIEEPSEADGTWDLYTSYQTNRYGNSWKQFPYKAVGKVYIKNVGSCSGAVISPHNLVVTAAHCVYDRGNGWYDGWTFVPAERNYAAPFGKWTARWVTMLTAYKTIGGREHDLALIKLKPKWIYGRSRPVSYYTGYLGRSWNYAYKQSFFSTGYPGDLPNGSKFQYMCAAESFYFRTDVIGMGCNMTYGSSGGPWIRKFYPYRSGAVNYVNSVVSGWENPLPFGKSFIGPRFTSDNIKALCDYEGC